MSKLYRSLSECIPSHEGTNAYIYAIVPVVGNGLAAITSANEVLLLDRQNLSSSPVLRISDTPQSLSCLLSGDESGVSIICSGGDGVVATYDVRSQNRSNQLKIDRAVTALACKGNSIAVGSELANHQAIVSVWDRRQNKQVWQNSENNDDITVLDFHPSQNNVLLSGGDDGSISIFDFNIAEEDDSLLQGLSHGPIHKAGFVGDQRFFALSSDQDLAIHPLSSADEEEDPAPTLLGDIRPIVPCEYVIDVLRSRDECIVVTGSNISKTQVNLVELHNATSLSKTPRLRSASSHVLEGAHGEEVVRSVFVDDATGTIFTAGEDGRIKAFQCYDTAVKSPGVVKGSKVKTLQEARYKPY